MVVDPSDEVLDGVHLFGDPTILVGLLRHVFRVEEVHRGEFHHVVHLSSDEEVQRDPSPLHASPQDHVQSHYLLPTLRSPQRPKT